MCCCLISTQLSSIRLSFPNNILLLGVAETAEIDREANRRYQLSEPNIETERNRNQHKSHESIYEEM